MEFTPQQSASTSRLKLCKEYFPMSPDIFNATDSDEEGSSLADGSANSCSSNQTSEDIEDNEVAFLRRRIQVLEIENRSLYRKIDDMEKKNAEHIKVNAKRPRTSHLLVPLLHASTVEIEKSELDEVLVVAKASRENLNATVNRLLEAVYSKTFLGSHSLSGGVPKTKKTMSTHPNQTVKPGLPKNDLDDIIRFVKNTWKEIHGDVLPEKNCPVRSAIKVKLSTEYRALKNTYK